MPWAWSDYFSAWLHRTFWPPLNSAESNFGRWGSNWSYNGPMPVTHSPSPLRCRSERYFNAMLQCLDNTWHVFHNVPYVLKDQTGTMLCRGEIDVIVFHPEHGYLVIEVKPGSWHYGQGKWSHRQVGKDTWQPPDSCPKTQASNGFFWMVNSIHDIHGNTPRPRVAWAVAFPDARRADCTVPEEFLPPEQMFFKDFEQDPVARILKAFETAQFRNHPSDPTKQQKIFERILPPVHVEMHPEAALDHNGLLLGLASKDVVQMGRMLRHQHRIQVIGPPGSGKTLLALSWLSAQEGTRACLCFNAPLARWLRSLPESESPFIEVRTFHDMGKEIIDSALPGSWPDIADQTFWDSHFLPLFLHALDALEGDFDGFDALAIDEGQDFSPEWLSIIPRLLAPEGRLAVFHDPEQNLRALESTEADIETLLELPPPLELETVRRVPQATLDWIHQELGVRYQQAEAFDAPAPRIVTVGWENPLHAAFDHELSILLESGISADRILVVSLHSRHRSGLRLEGLPASWSNDWKPGKVRVDSVLRLKGLEADIVFVVDWKESDLRDPVMRRRLLVAATRTRHSLVLFKET